MDVIMMTTMMMGKGCVRMCLSEGMGTQHHEASYTKCAFANRFLPKCVFKQQQTTNTIECWIWGKKDEETTTTNSSSSSGCFGKQTNNTCAVSLNDRANKQTASEPNNISDAAIHISLIHQFSVRDEIYIHIESDAQANKSDFEYAIWCWRIFVYIYGIRSWMRPGKTDVEALLTISNNN